MYRVLFLILAILSNNVFSFKMQNKQNSSNLANIVNRVSVVAPDDGGNIYTLTSLSVNCLDGEVLSGFQLTIPNVGYLQYVYQCLRSSAVNQDDNADYTTPLNDILSGGPTKSANFLDRHDLECPNNYGLQSFQMQRQNNKIFYKYVCVNIISSGCGDNETNTTPGGDANLNGAGGTLDLTKQKVQLTNNQFLKGLKLSVNYTSPKPNFWLPHYKYVYKFCTFANQDYTSISSTNN